MTRAVRVVDHGANALLRALGMATPAVVDVGIMGAEAGAQKNDAPGLTVAEVAETHEFGIGVPRRSWCAGYVDQAMAQIRANMRAIADAVIRRRLPPRPGLEQFGQKLVAGMQQRISDRIPPPLAPATLLAKTNAKGEVKDVPLINTGQLRSSITYRVRPGTGVTP